MRNSLNQFKSKNIDDIIFDCPSPLIKPLPQSMNNLDHFPNLIISKLENRCKKKNINSEVEIISDDEVDHFIPKVNFHHSHKVRKSSQLDLRNVEQRISEYVIKVENNFKPDSESVSNLKVKPHIGRLKKKPVANSLNCDSNNCSSQIGSSSHFSTSFDSKNKNDNNGNENGIPIKDKIYKNSDNENKFLKISNFVHKSPSQSNIRIENSKSQNKLDIPKSNYKKTIFNN